MSRSATRDTPGTVARVIRLLQHIAESGGDVSVKALSQSLALPPSTVHRQLQLLAQSGMVERRPASRSYRAGREFFRMASLVLKQFDVRDIVRPLLERLRDASGETAFFVAYLPAIHQAAIMEEVRSPNPLRYDLEPFTHRSLAWGSSGRAILAHLPETVVAQVLAQAGTAPASARSPPALGTIRAELRRIRARGYAMSRGHNVAGAVGIAAPVFDAGGTVLGSIGLTIPDVRFDPVKTAKLAALTMDAAERACATLGYRRCDQARRAGR